MSRTGRNTTRLAFGSRFWRKNSACALVFSPSDPERSRLEVYVNPLRGLFFFSKIWSDEILLRFPWRFPSFLTGLKKVLHAYKSKQQEEVPSKQSALKSVKVMPYMESWQYIGLWQYIGPWQYIGRDRAYERKEVPCSNEVKKDYWTSKSVAHARITIESRSQSQKVVDLLRVLYAKTPRPCRSLPFAPSWIAMG